MDHAAQEHTNQALASNYRDEIAGRRGAATRVLVDVKRSISRLYLGIAIAIYRERGEDGEKDVSIQKLGRRRLSLDTRNTVRHDEKNLYAGKQSRSLAICP